MSGMPFFAYRSFQKEFETVRRFYKAGIRQFCIFPANTVNSLGQNYSEYPPNWYWYQKYEFKYVDQQITDLLKIAPDAELLLIIDLNSPIWLIRSQMNNLCDSMMGLTDALTTPVWRDAMTTYLHNFLEHVENTFPGRISAYILGCGMTDEWMDYSQGRELPCKTEKFQEWCLKHNYEIPEHIPTLSQRRRSNRPLQLRSHEKDELSIRYWHFIADTIAEGIAYFARETRKLIPQDTKLGCFYGYILELGNQRLVECGHLAYEKVFSLPELDFFISPGSYCDRQMGGGAGYMMPNGTIHCKGKNWLHEIDHRTSTANMYLTPYVTLQSERWHNEHEDIAGLRREFCLALFHGASLWWFDMWGKFYESNLLLEEIRKMKQIFETYADVDNEPESEIAIFLDPDSAYLVSDTPSDNIAKELFSPLKDNLNKIGAPYRFFSLEDLPSVKDLDRIRLAILPGLFQITQHKEELLKKYLLNSKRSIVWTYGAGLTDETHSTPEKMKELTGVPMGTSIVSTVEQSDWRSIFIPETSYLTPEFLRNLASSAGVHLFTDIPEPVWYGNNLLTIHTAQAGKQTIHLKEPAIPEVLLGNSLNIEEPVTSFSYDFKSPETILVHLKSV